MVAKAPISRPVVTTSELLERLKRLGLTVDRQALADARRDGYLPEADRRQRQDSLWTPVACQRAERLFRLRKRFQVAGGMLQLLLYLRDGWGWANVQPLVISGTRKVVALQSGPVRALFRKPDPRAVELYVPDIAEKLGIASEPLARFLIGLLNFGAPLPNGSALPLFSAMRSSLHPEALATLHITPDVATLGSGVLAGSRLSAREILSWIENCDDTAADYARRRALQHLPKLERALTSPIGGPYPNAPNGGARKGLLCAVLQAEASFDELLRKARRITRAQLVSLVLVPFLLMEHPLIKEAIALS